MNKQFGASWWKRKITYAIAAVVTTVLAGFGIVSAAQADNIAQIITMIVMIFFGAGAPALAFGNTHEGSDSTVTAKDVMAAKGEVAAAIGMAVKDAFAKIPEGMKPASEGPLSDEEYMASVRGE